MTDALFHHAIDLCDFQSKITIEMCELKNDYNIELCVFPGPDPIEKCGGALCCIERSSRISRAI